jgi:hypothetical protein
MRLHQGFELHRCGFALTAPLKIVRKKVEEQIWQETTTKQDQGTKKKTLAIDLLWAQEESTGRSSTSFQAEVWKQS